MFTLLSYIGLTVSVSGMVYLVIRVLPRMRVLPESAPIPRAKWEHVVIAARDNMYWRKWQPRIMAFLARLLHRSRLRTLKMDNRLSRWIESVRKRSRLVSARSRSWIIDRQLAHKKEPAISFAVLTEQKLKTKEDELLKSIQENPKDPVAYRELGELYERMGNQSDATEVMAAAIKLEAVLAANPEQDMISGAASGVLPSRREAPGEAENANVGAEYSNSNSMGQTGTRPLVRRRRRKSESV